jgi:thymidylate kinase
MTRGKFIVLYGANNLGKTTQVGMLDDRLLKIGGPNKVLKYPIYELEPTGSRINQALRGGLEISDEGLQREFAQNRRDFEPELKRILKEGTWVLAEDYTGTGIAWGVAHDIPLETMEKMNRDLLKEDVAVLLDGERFRD